MKTLIIIFLAFLFFTITSCSPKDVLYDPINQKVIYERNTFYTYDSTGHETLNVSGPYVLYTSYDDKDGNTQLFSVERGSAKYIDSVKCICRAELQAMLDDLDKLNKPCK